MFFSLHGIRISIFLIALCGVFFFFNLKPKFLVPIKNIKNKYGIVYTVLFGLLIFFVILLPFRITFVSDKYVAVVKDVPIQIVFDVSLSMAATDLLPSRFSAAKDSLISLVQNLGGYYISLITFSGKPFIYIPFSSDTSAIVFKLETMNLSDFPPVQDFLGTAIGDALLLSINNLKQISYHTLYKPGIVILITDGDSNVGFDPMQILSFYQKFNIPLFVLGVGQEKYLIGYDYRNDSVVTDINIPLLQELASKTGGKFYRVLGEKTFDVFLAELSQYILDSQQQKVQYVLWELNNCLLYLIIITLFCLLVLKIVLLYFSKKKYK